MWYIIYWKKCISDILMNIYEYLLMFKKITKYILWMSHKFLWLLLIGWMVEMLAECVEVIERLTEWESIDEYDVVNVNRHLGRETVV